MFRQNKTLIEGLYLYAENNQQYAEEHFKVFSQQSSDNFVFQSEILTRLQSGETLKIRVNFEFNPKFQVLYSEIEKSVANQIVVETFKVDPIKMQLLYKFKNQSEQHEFTKNLGAKHYLSSPAICTLGLFSLTKKFDPNGRTPVVFISSDNVMNYSHHPTDKLVFAEYLGPSDIVLNNNELESTLIKLYEFDGHEKKENPATEIYLSKHYGIPYQLIFENKKIAIQYLRKND